MTQTRTPHSPARPTLTGGDDRPATPCLGRWWLFDALIDHAESRSRPGFRDALVREARDVCEACPISRQCLTVDNADQRWAQLIVGKPRPQYVSQRRTEEYTKHHNERFALLVALVKEGGRLEEALTATGLTKPHQLYKWCHRYGHLDLWRDLTPHLKPNQHRSAA